MKKATVPLVVKFLRSVLPDVQSLLQHAGENNGWFKYRRTTAQAFVELNASRHVVLYGDEKNIVGCFLLGLLGETIAREIFTRFASMNLEEAFEAGEELAPVLEHALDSFPRLPKTETEAAEVKAKLEALLPEERAASLQRWQFFMWGLLAAFYQWLSIMVHGEKLTALVARAMRGDDNAFVKAVQIDRDLLSEAPAFRERYKRAELTGDQEFFDKLSYRIKNPIAKGKIQQPLLWLTFAVLDTLRCLDGSLSNSELLAILDQVGLDLVQDERSFVKVLKSYRQYKDRSVVSST